MAASPLGSSAGATLPRRIRRWVLGAPRDIHDSQLFHRLSLVAFLAWVGLGADGLSSSAYGPEEAYKALGGHTHLSLLILLMMTATIAMISIAYSNLIAHFPGGGGGYLVATRLLGAHFGVVSGCALLVDYVLTISISIASACDQVWSFLPEAWLPWKLLVEVAALGLLIVLNLRGVKESVALLAPIFMLFIVSHVFAILYAVGSHVTRIPEVVGGAATDLKSSVATLGWLPVLMILLRAYSLGGGTYTGIEAVSNGIATLREPRVKTARRTMLLMAVSLAFTAGGILLAYLLTESQPLPGRTMNSVMLTNLFGSWSLGGVLFGPSLVIGCLLAEAALLFVAAQTGFVDGPRVLANMALDSWMPHRFAHLSERLVVQNGVLVMGLAGAAALLYTGGDIGILVVMYSINVFVTFSLTELGMARHWIATRRQEPRWRGQLAIHGTGLVMCLTILCVTIFEKFTRGGWITLAITTVVIAGRGEPHRGRWAPFRIRDARGAALACRSRIAASIGEPPRPARAHGRRTRTRGTQPAVGGAEGQRGQEHVDRAPARAHEELVRRREHERRREAGLLPRQERSEPAREQHRGDSRGQGRKPGGDLVHAAREERKEGDQPEEERRLVAVQVPLARERVVAQMRHERRGVLDHLPRHEREARLVRRHQLPAGQRRKDGEEDECDEKDPLTERRGERRADRPSVQRRESSMQKDRL